MTKGFADRAEAVEALQSVAPEIKCLVCGASRFECVDFAIDKVRTSINLHKIPSVPSQFVRTPTLAGANCGFVMRFLEPTLAEHRGGSGT